MSAETNSIISNLNSAIATAQSIATWVPPGGGGSLSPLPPVSLLGGTLAAAYDLTLDDTGSGSSENLLTHYDRKLRNGKDSRVSIFGHSQVQEMQTSGVHFAEQFGCGGESSRRLWNRLRQFSTARMMTHGGVGVLWTGVCDLSQSAFYSSYTEAAQTVGAAIFPTKFAPAMTGRWIIVLPLPIDQDYAPQGFNAGLQTMAQWIVSNSVTGAFTSHTSASVQFVNVWGQMVDGGGNLKDEYQLINANGLRDGVHLSAAGYAVVEEAINAKILTFY